MKFSPYDSPHPSCFCGVSSWVSSRNFNGFPERERRGWGKQAILWL